MKSNKHDMYHTTEREIAFIDGLGTYSENPKNMSVIDILKGYINGLSKRVNVAGMNRNKITQHAVERLNREIKKGLL